jgi:beta-lactamase class A
VNRVFKFAVVLALTLPIFYPTAATSKSVAISPLETPIHQLIPLLKGTIAPKDYFDPTFLKAVPEAQFRKISKEIIAQHGQPIRILKIDKKSQESAIITLEFERAIGTVNLNILRTPPYAKVNGLLFTGFTAKNDHLQKLDADFAALPGRAGYVIEQLNEDGSRKVLAARAADQQFAIASTFKLYILAELASEIEAGERKWSDVVPLSQRSFSSQATRGWPKDSLVTLETLALQMISVSDNSATDTLLHVLGRSAVERKLALVGHSNPDKMLPFLSTVEAFGLKSPANAALRAKFIAASEAEQRQLIEQSSTRLTFEAIEKATFADGPASIDTIEWFASPSDIAALLNHIRRTRNDKMLGILQVNPGIAPASAAKWQYLGYKGGSETGVISMSFLARSLNGKWIALSASWNNNAINVDEARFLGLVTRALDLVGD